MRLTEPEDLNLEKKKPLYLQKMGLMVRDRRGGSLDNQK
jgi:hypothetical protein